MPRSVVIFDAIEQPGHVRPPDAGEFPVFPFGQNIDIEAALNLTVRAKPLRDHMTFQIVFCDRCVAFSLDPDFAAPEGRP